MDKRSCSAIIPAVLLLVLIGCDGSSGGDTFTTTGIETSVDPANLDPALFVSRVDNPLFPLTPGTTSVYGGDEDVVVETTERTRTIQGITATVVRDRVFEDGVLVEDTEDWFAQDVEGNVWYLGEDVKDFDEEGNVVSTGGSFEAGVNGAQPGIQMPATPQVGQIYSQEMAPGVAEDMSENLATNETVETAVGTFTGCLKRKEFNPLEPGKEEEKWFCPGIGLVRAVVSADPDPEEIGKTVAIGSTFTGPANIDELFPEEEAED